jgi:hypothetical protein
MPPVAVTEVFQDHGLALAIATVGCALALVTLRSSWVLTGKTESQIQRRLMQVLLAVSTATGIYAGGAATYAGAATFIEFFKTLPPAVIGVLGGLAAVFLFRFRGRHPFAYGVGEVLVGAATLWSLSAVGPQISEWALKFAAAIYVMIRGFVNMQPAAPAWLQRHMDRWTSPPGADLR